MGKKYATNAKTKKTKMDDYIKLYQSLGFSIIPLDYKTKKPSIDWKEFQKRKPTEEELKKWFNGTKTNIGVVCGEVSGNLLCVDFEKPELVNEFFPKQDIHQHTFCTKTGRGEHIYLQTDKPLKTRSIPGIVDLIAENHLAVLAPSVHPTGKNYEKIGQDRLLKVSAKEFEDLFWKKAEELGYYKKTGVTTKYGTISTKRTLEIGDYTPPCIRNLQAGSPEGRRNITAFTIATYYKNSGKTKEQLQTILYEWNKKNQKPINAEEIDSVIDSVIENEYGVGCTTDLLKQNCTATKPGDCIFKDPLFLLKELTNNVKIVAPIVADDPTKYEIEIENKIIALTTDKMLNPRLFLQRWMEQFGTLIEIGPNAWREIVGYWSSIAEYHKQDAAASIEEYIKTTILKQVVMCDITTDKNRAKTERGMIYAEARYIINDNLKHEGYYANKHLFALIEKSRLKVDPGRLKTLLLPFLTRNSARFLGERFWCFDLDKLSLEFEIDILSHYVDESVDEPENTKLAEHTQ
jgi:hypothetical protein